MRSSADGHGRPGVAGRDHGRGLAVAHQLGRPHQRGVLLAAHPAGRVLVHGDDLGAGARAPGPGCRPPGRAGPPGRRRRRARSAARRAPSTISPGALSPPMASTATGSVASVSGEGRSPRRLKSVDLDRLAPLVPAAARADHVRRLGRLAVRAHAAGRAGPGATPPAWWLRPLALDFFFFGTAMDGLQRSVRALRALTDGAGPRRNRLPEHVEVSPPGIAWGNAATVALVAVGPALGAQAGAVLPAQGRHGQLEHDGVAHQRPQVDVVVDDRVELLVRRARQRGRRRSARGPGCAAPPTPARRSAGRSRPTAR